MDKYSIEIISDSPPRIFVGDHIAGGKVVAIKDDNPPLVTMCWLTDRYSLSANTIAAKLESIAQGTTGKRLYPRQQAVAILNGDLTRKLGRKRKN